MTDLRQIITDWTTVNGGGKVTVMYFLDAIPVADQRTALAALWGVVDGAQASSTQWTIRTSGISIDDATGALVDAWSESSIKTHAGEGDGQPVADATQALIRWNTASIINGRFLKGRTFLPGLVTGNESGGNLSGATISAIQAGINTFIASAAGLAVWHRPTSGTGGSSDAVSTGSMWNEFAVLRRRRH